MYCPRGWAVSGQRVIIGQPLISESSTILSKSSKKSVVPITGSCTPTIRTNPLGDLWMDMENRRKMASDTRITEESSIESSTDVKSDVLTSADLGTSLESEEASLDTSESVAGSACHLSPSNLSSEESSYCITKDQLRTQEFFETQAKMSETWSQGSSPCKSAIKEDIPLVMVHASKTGERSTCARSKRTPRRKKKLQAQQEFDMENETDRKKVGTSLEKKSSASLDRSINKARNSENSIKVPVSSLKGKKSPTFRISNEEDLLRATAIIKENLSNIVENYLVQSAPGSDTSVSPSKLALDKTFQAYKTSNKDASDMVTISSMNLVNSALIADSSQNVDSKEKVISTEISKNFESLPYEIDKSSRYKTKDIPLQSNLGIESIQESVNDSNLEGIENSCTSVLNELNHKVDSPLSHFTNPVIKEDHNESLSYAAVGKISSGNGSEEEKVKVIGKLSDSDESQHPRSPHRKLIKVDSMEESFDYVSIQPEDNPAKVASDGITSIQENFSSKLTDEINHPSIDIIDETGLSCPYDENQASAVAVTLEDIAAKIDKMALANKLCTQLSDLASEGSFESLPYNALFSQSGSFNDDSDPQPPVAITFHSYQHYENVRKLVRQKSSGSEDILEEAEPEDAVSTDVVKEAKSDLDAFGMVDMTVAVTDSSHKEGSLVKDMVSEEMAVDQSDISTDPAPCKVIIDNVETRASEIPVDLLPTSADIDTSTGEAVATVSNENLRGKLLFDSGPLQDSGMETSVGAVGLSEDSNSIVSNKCLPPSPVDSVPESGFSSLKETFVADHNLSEDSPEMSFSKSKDSLDLTDNEKFPGTDTLSDDIETLSYNTGGVVSTFGSRTVSVEGSASDITSLDSSSNGAALLQSCGTSRDLPDIDLDTLVIPNNHTEKGLCRQLALQATLSMQESREMSCNIQAERRESPENDSITERNSLRGEKFGSEEGSSLGIKTSDSISSEDTIMSKISMEEHTKVSIEERSSSKGSSEDHSKVSLDECSRLSSSTDQSKMSVDDTSKFSDRSKFSLEVDPKCSIDSEFLSLDDPSFGPTVLGQNNLKMDPQVSSLEVIEPIGETLKNSCSNIKSSVIEHIPCNDDKSKIIPKLEREPAGTSSSVALETIEEAGADKSQLQEPPLFEVKHINLSEDNELEVKSFDKETLEQLTNIVKDNLPHLQQSHNIKKISDLMTPFPSVEKINEGLYPEDDLGQSVMVVKHEPLHKAPNFAGIVEEEEDCLDTVLNLSSKTSTEVEAVAVKQKKSKSHEVHKRRKRKSRMVVKESTSQEDFPSASSADRTTIKHTKSSRSKHKQSSEYPSQSPYELTQGEACSRPSLNSFTSSSGSTQDDDQGGIGVSASRVHSLMKRESQSGVSHFGSASSSIHSDDSNIQFEGVSLRSDGSLDRFPHFDAVRAQVKPRTPKKNRQSVNLIEKKETKVEFMHRSVTLPVGSLLSKKDNSPSDKTEEKERLRKHKEESKQQKKKKKDSDKSEKKSTMSSIKGLLKRKKSKEKDIDLPEKEEKTSPSIFRRLERKGKSQSPSPQHDIKNKSNTSSPGSDKPTIKVLRDTFTKLTSDFMPEDSKGHSEMESVPSPSSTIKRKPGTGVDMGVSATVLRTTTAQNKVSPVTSPRHVHTSPRKGNSISPQLYRRVLTRNISSSQESLESNSQSSTPSPQVSPQKRPSTASSFHSLSGAREVMVGSSSPKMGTKALNNQSVSVIIGFKPQVKPRSRTKSGSGSFISNAKEKSRPSSEISMPDSKIPSYSASSSPTKINKKFSSMEILVCGKIREHIPAGDSKGGSLSREGSFRLHREISVETVTEIPEGSPLKANKSENYQEYLHRVQASRDSRQSSTWSLCEIDESNPVQNFGLGVESETGASTVPATQTLPRPGARHSVPHSRHHQHPKVHKKMSLPYSMYLSERTGTPESTGSTTSLQSHRSSSPFTRGMPQSSSFTASPFRKSYSTASTPTAVSPVKRSMFTSSGIPTGNYASPSSGEVYSDRQLTTNFEL